MGTEFPEWKGPAHKIASHGFRPGNPLRNDMPSPAPAQLASIYRYPVKGLTPEPLARAELKPGQTLLADRRYAIENGPSGFDPAAPAWMSKAYFLMLMRDEWLAGLNTHFDDASHTLTIRHNGKVAAQGNLETAEGRAAIETFIATDLCRPDQGPAQGAVGPRPQFFRCRPQGRLHH